MPRSSTLLDLELIKFPRTPHLITLSNNIDRTDLVLDELERQKFVRPKLVSLEEKVDGTNLGISFDRNWNAVFQKRSHIVTHASETQFKKLESWYEQRKYELVDVLSQKYILFGEWCAATHSVAYDQLPDYFIAFDLYDREARSFLPKSTVQHLLGPTSIHLIADIATSCSFTLDELTQLANTQKSSYASNQLVEGVYLRTVDEKGTIHRAKIVRAEFLQQIEDNSRHWSQRMVQWNSVRSDLWTTIS